MKILTKERIVFRLDEINAGDILESEAQREFGGILEEDPRRELIVQKDEKSMVTITRAMRFLSNQIVNIRTYNFMDGTVQDKFIDNCSDANYNFQGYNKLLEGVGI
ncbi:MAG: hypothetical protein WC781_03930 [Candidatus Pacearchaeota archaeon]|jgi:hypothetical protein